MPKPVRCDLRVAVFLGFAALTACGAPASDSARSDWLLHLLETENLPWLAREPEQLEAKFSAMAEHPYNFMRGTLAVYFSDLASATAPRLETSFLRNADASTVSIVGDPHPENLGAVLIGDGPSGMSQGDLAQAELSLEWVDLDAVSHGPWLIDLRRAALGLATLTLGLDGCELACRANLVGALGEAYVTEVFALERGEAEDATLSGRRDSGSLVQMLVDEIYEEGPERKKLLKYTDTSEDGVNLTFRLDDQVTLAGAGNLALGAPELELLGRLVEEYRLSDAAPEGFRFLEVMRRFGTGISSRPALRYFVLWDRGESGYQDDELLQIREVTDAPVIPRGSPSLPGVFRDNAERVGEGPRRLWYSEDADPRATGLRDGILQFKALNGGSWYQDLDRDKVEEAWSDGEATESDLVKLGETVALVLAHTHARGTTIADAAALPVIADDLIQSAATESQAAVMLSEELQNTARRDLLRLQSDFGLFLELLEDRGPLLGTEHLIEKGP